MDPNEFQEKIERKYLLILLERMNTNTITEADIHESARLVMSMRPFGTFDEAKSKLDFMSTKYAFFADLKAYVLGLEAETCSKDVVDKMHAHLRENDVDSALEIARAHIQG